MGIMMKRGEGMLRLPSKDTVEGFRLNSKTQTLEIKTKTGYDVVIALDSSEDIYQILRDIAQAYSIWKENNDETGRD